VDTQKMQTDNMGRLKLNARKPIQITANSKLDNECGNCETTVPE